MKFDVKNSRLWGAGQRSLFIEALKTEEGFCQHEVDYISRRAQPRDRSIVQKLLQVPASMK